MSWWVKKLDRTADLLKALGHPARLQIAEMLRDGEACVCHLEANLGYRQPYISQQIMVLRKAGLVAERRDGTYVFYRLSDPRVTGLLDLLLPESPNAEGRPSYRRLPCSCPACSPAEKLTA